MLTDLFFQITHVNELVWLKNITIFYWRLLVKFCELSTVNVFLSVRDLLLYYYVKRTNYEYHVKWKSNSNSFDCCHQRFFCHPLLVALLLYPPYCCRNGNLWTGTVLVLKFANTESVLPSNILYIRFARDPPSEPSVDGDQMLVKRALSEW